MGSTAYARGCLLGAGLAVAIGCGPQVGGDDGAEGGTGSVESDGSQGEASASHSGSGEGSGDGAMPNPSAGDPSEGDSTGDPSDGGPTGDPTGDTGDTGPAPDDLCDVGLAMGLSGLTNQRSCDTGPDDDCLSPSPGVPVAVFDQNPLVGGAALDLGELDPAIVALDQATSDASGRFQFALPSGSYVVCRLQGESSAFCSEAIAIDDAAPLSKAIYETGNGDWWAVIDCAP